MALSPSTQRETTPTEPTHGDPLDLTRPTLFSLPSTQGTKPMGQMTISSLEMKQMERDLTQDHNPIKMTLMDQDLITLIIIRMIPMELDLDPQEMTQMELNHIVHTIRHIIKQILQDLLEEEED